MRAWRLLPLALAVLLVGCQAPRSADATLLVRVTAGPICPVVTDPPDPNCADAPVAGAVVVVEDHGGREVARGTADQEGLIRLALASGTYRVVPQAVDGLMGTAVPVDVVLSAGGQAEVMISYDTGIR
jgi:hypothetical protein